MGRIDTLGGTRQEYVNAAGEVARVLGDGCVAFELTDERATVRAVAHRDVTMSAALERALDEEQETAETADWCRQAATAGYAIAFDLGAARSAPVGERVAALAGFAALAASDGAALLAVRDASARPYLATERAALEAILRKRFSRPDGVLDGRAMDADVPMWVVDDRKRVRHANQAFSEVVGLPVTRILGMPLAELLERGTLPPRPDGEPEDRVVLRADGAERWLQVHARPLVGEAHGAVVYTGFDVTERRAREVKARVELDCERMLRSFAEFLLGQPPAEEIHRAATSLIAQQFGAPLVTLSAIARSLDEAVMLSEAGAIADPETGRRRPRVQVPARSIAYEAMTSEELVTVNDYGDPRSYLVPGPVALRAGARSAACAPVAESLCLSVLRQEAGAISSQETEFLDGVARLLSARVDLVAPPSL